MTPASTLVPIRTSSRRLPPAPHLQPTRLGQPPIGAYDWPGNVRELFAVIESASIRAGSARIEAQHLPPEVRDATGPRDAQPRYRAGTIDAQERESILAALDQTGGVLARSADLLGMGRTTLWRKLKSYGITAGDQSTPGQSASER
jgi:transcriptional regulator of acetoin/glycerol metabolism